MRGAPHWSLALALCLVATSAVLARDGEKCFHKRHKRPGTCRPLSSCPSVSAELIKHAGSAQNCARKGSSAVTVCCPSREEVAVPLAGWDDEPPPEDTSGQLPCHRVLAMGDSQDKIRGPPGTIARTMCQRYNRFVCSKKSQTAIEESFGGSNVIDYCESHNKTDQLIVGGRPARPKEYPHMALLGFGDQPGVSFDCGGSIISPRFILTAAHCLFREREPVKWVLVGAKSRTEKPHAGGRPQLIGISERISHPDYKPPVKYNDIALLRLKEDISFDEGFARPACIHTEPGIERRESSATVTGWGLTEWDGDQSALLMTVTLNLTTPRSCQKSYEPSTGTPRGIIGTQICAGSRGKDSCQGDSGGPLQLLPNDPYCMFHIIGVVSFGAFCGFQFPGVYTRVAPFVPWIEGIVWPQN